MRWREMRNCCDVGGGLVAAIGGQITTYMYILMFNKRVLRNDHRLLECDHSGAAMMDN